MYLEFDNAFQNGKIASFLGVDGGHSIDSSLSLLRLIFNLGVRFLSLTNDCDTPWSTSSQSQQNISGLTIFGQKIVEEMNRLGMLIDLSHSSYQTQLDTLNQTKAPVIFSRSACYTLCKNSKNIKDDILLKLVNFKALQNK
jgi:membrane dipeptidase